MNLSLYLDTSILGMAFALKSEDGKVLCREYSSAKGAASASLPTLLKKSLAALSLDESSINTVVVSKGPGSFTGIRIGLAWAMGFCQKDSGRKLLGVSSLSCLASAFRKKEGENLSVLLANTKTSGFLACTGDEGVSLSFQEGALEVKKLEPLFVDSFYEKIEDQRGVQKIFSKEELAKEALEAMLTEVDLQDKNLVAENSFVEPLYLRKSSVEEKLK